jgi:lipopolysaccharide transport system permease protein
MWFNKAIMNSSNSIIAGKGLILNVGIPSIFFPLVMIVQSTLKQLPVFFILFVFVWMLGSTPDLNWFSVLPVMFVQFLMTVWLGALLAALVPFIRDISFLVPTGLTFLMFLSGIFFNYQQLPSEWHDLFLMNPIAFLLKCYRDILLNEVPPDFLLLSIWAFISVIGCIFTFWLYQKLRYVFPKIVLS